MAVDRLREEVLAILRPTGYGAVTALTKITFVRLFLTEGRPVEARPLLESARAFYADPVAYRKRAEIDALLRRCDKVVAVHDLGR